MGSFRLSLPGLAAGLAFLLAAAGCGNLPEPLSCSASTPCPAGSWCRAGQCAANAPPVAVIALPASPGANRPVTIGGAGSHDDDPGDAVASWSWTLRPPAGTTGCEPIATSGPGSEVTAVFPCPGDHEVSLVVTDSLGAESPPSVARVRVAPAVDPPVVEVGADVAVDHRCTGTPLACTTWDGAFSDVGLSTSATAPGGGPFTYRWTVEPPPELAGQPAPRVTFTPGDAVASPRVRIETDGTAIAGRWVFAVTATDARGMVAVGRQRVDVGNRPPTLVGGGRLELPHSFDAGSRRFIATGEIPPATWSDPDGDPVAALGFTVRRSGDGGGVFDVQGIGDRARVTIVVPFTQPADASFLIGPGVSRRVELVVADANGARATTGWDVTVTNRAPRLAAAVPETAVDHTYEASFLRYAAQARLSTWLDDDGDPIALSLSGDAACTEVAERQGTAWVTCGTPFTGRPDPGPIVGLHELTVSSSDPFEPGPSQATRLEVRNRAPRLAAASVHMTVECTVDRFTCCDPGPAKGTCELPEHRYEAASASVPVVLDDDGDPLDLAAPASGSCLGSAVPAVPCVGAGCEPVLSFCAMPWACGANVPVGTLSVTASDGLAAVSGPVVVAARCPP